MDKRLILAARIATLMTPDGHLDDRDPSRAAANPGPGVPGQRPGALLVLCGVAAVLAGAGAAFGQEAEPAERGLPLSCSTPADPGAETPSSRVIETPAARALGQGRASYYGKPFHGRLTANGERFDKHALTMAHRQLPFGSWVRVTHVRNGRSVVLRVNDRGPWTGGRIADVSHEAARQLGMLREGVTQVRLELLPEEPRAGAGSPSGC